MKREVKAEIARLSHLAAQYLIPEEEIPKNATNITVTYDAPQIQPRAGQLWEHESGVRFRLYEDMSNDLRMVDDDNWKSCVLRDGVDYVWGPHAACYVSSTTWLNENCKLVEDAK